MKPSGVAFTAAVPSGDLSDTSDRWTWIDDGEEGTPNGIIGAWSATGRGGQRVLVGKTIKVDSLRFTLVPDEVLLMGGLLPGQRVGMQVNDDLDVP